MFPDVNDRAALTLFDSSSSPAIIQLCLSPCAKFALNLWLNNHFRNHVVFRACAGPSAIYRRLEKSKRLMYSSGVHANWD